MRARFSATREGGGSGVGGRGLARCLFSMLTRLLLRLLLVAIRRRLVPPDIHALPRLRDLLASRLLLF